MNQCLTIQLFIYLYKYKYLQINLYIEYLYLFNDLIFIKIIKTLIINISY